MLRLSDLSKAVEQLNYALGTCLSNRLAGAPTDACFTLYFLKAPSVGLIKSQQRLSSDTIPLSQNSNRYRFRGSMVVHGL